MEGETRMRFLVVIMLAVCVLASTASGVLLPENWDRLTCKVSTGDSVGTAFILRYKGQIVAVTNRHVVDPGRSVFHLRLRTDLLAELVDDTTRISDYENEADSLRVLPNDNMYFTDSVYDIAFVRLKVAVSVLDVAVVPESGIAEDSMILPGREVFFLGYPSGMAGRTAHTPLVRTATVAGEHEHKIILDGNFFGGSSGSPIFLESDPQNGVTSSQLIGIVCEERLRAARRRGGAPPLYAENIGIGIGIKISYVIAALNGWMTGWE